MKRLLTMVPLPQVGEKEGIPTEWRAVHDPNQNRY